MLGGTDCREHCQVSTGGLTAYPQPVCFSGDISMHAPFMPNNKVTVSATDKLEHLTGFTQPQSHYLLLTKVGLSTQNKINTAFQNKVFDFRLFKKKII